MLSFLDLHHPRIVKRLSGCLTKGRLVGLMGPNGAGKTTLLKIAAGLIASSDSVTISHRPLEDISLEERSRLISYLESSPQAVWNILVKTLLGILGPGPSPSAHQWVQKMGVEPFLDRPIHYLSAGERQRVFLTATLARPADIFLLDEPLRHLDARFQRITMASLRTLAHEENKAILVVLHESQMATTYCDEIWSLEPPLLAEDLSGKALGEKEDARQKYS